MWWIENYSSLNVSAIRAVDEKLFEREEDRIVERERRTRYVWRIANPNTQMLALQWHFVKLLTRAIVPEPPGQYNPMTDKRNEFKIKVLDALPLTPHLQQIFDTYLGPQGVDTPHGSTTQMLLPAELMRATIARMGMDEDNLSYEDQKFVELNLFAYMQWTVHQYVIDFFAKVDTIPFDYWEEYKSWVNPSTTSISQSSARGTALTRPMVVQTDGVMCDKRFNTSDLPYTRLLVPFRALPDRAYHAEEEYFAGGSHPTDRAVAELRDIVITRPHTYFYQPPIKSASSPAAFNLNPPPVKGSPRLEKTWNRSLFISKYYANPSSFGLSSAVDGQTIYVSSWYIGSQNGVAIRVPRINVVSYLVLGSDGRPLKLDRTERARLAPVRVLQDGFQSFGVLDTDKEWLDNEPAIDDAITSPNDWTVMTSASTWYVSPAMGTLQLPQSLPTVTLP
jgi:hypothetical protein